MRERERERERGRKELKKENFEFVSSCYSVSDATVSRGDQYVFTQESARVFAHVSLKQKNL